MGVRKNWGPSTERNFQKWYAKQAKKTGLNPNPDDKRHHYDYRAAYKARVEPDASGHWPSKYKHSTHPRLIVGGRNTKTGKKVKSRRK